MIPGGIAAYSVPSPKMLLTAYCAILLIASPNMDPSMPPARPSMLLSVMNMVIMSLFLAPIAFIIPISRVLSRTAVNIVFIMPIPPTKRLIAAIPTKTTCIMLNTALKLSIRSVLVWTLKSSFPSFWCLSLLIVFSILSAISSGFSPFAVWAAIIAYPSVVLRASLAFASGIIMLLSIIAGSPVRFSLPMTSNVMSFIVILSPVSTFFWNKFLLARL